MKRTFLVDSVLIFVLATILIWPLFRLKYMDNWPSIESTFISDSRMLSEHLPHPGWQPLWYTGTRFDYIYPPALRYGPALIARAGHMTTARAYHLYTAFFYVFGIVAVYWMVRIGSTSRMAGILAAAATALTSPSFLLMPAIRHDSDFRIPQRLHVLTLYGEGPHISSLSILPAALAASFLALRRWRPAALAAAAVFGALVVANNFYGATALGVLFPLVVWSVWTSDHDWRIFPRAAGIAALAWGLSAFWLTPSYLKVTLTNLRLVSPPGKAVPLIAILIGVGLFCAITWWLGKSRPDRAWTIFVAGAAIFLSFDVLGFTYSGYRMAGDPLRFVPELDLALILAAVEFLRYLWRHPRLRGERWRIAVVIAIAFVPSLRYIRRAWTPFPKAGALENQYPYQMSKWVHDNLPGQRVLPTGELRFWFDGWFDNAQPDGGSAQGIENQIQPEANWQILVGDKPGLATAWLQALGTDAAIVPGVKSLEPYRDYAYPAKFSGVLPVLYDNRHGTLVYRIPRIYPNIGRIVDKDAIQAVAPFRGGDDAEGMAKYLAVVENPEQPATSISWRGFDEVDIEAQTAPGRSILLQETFDPYWRAFEGGRELTVRPERVMGFMLIDVPAGNHSIQMRFQTPLENRVGELLLVLSVLLVGGLGALSFTRGRDSLNSNPSIR